MTSEVHLVASIVRSAIDAKLTSWKFVALDESSFTVQTPSGDRIRFDATVLRRLSPEGAARMFEC